MCIQFWYSVTCMCEKHRPQLFIVGDFHSEYDHEYDDRLCFPVCRQNLDSGLDQGSAFALYHRGELVVEFSGGYADHDAEVPWTKETLCQIASSSKGVAAITTAMLVDR